MKNYLYISICCINNWQSVITNIYNKLKTYNLYNEIDEIRCVVSCKDESFKNFHFFLDPKIVILEHFTENFGFTFEKKIMDYLLRDSKKEIFNVLYLHSKGVSDRHINNKNIISWTNVMLYFCLKHFKHIINNLYNCDAIGINLITEPVLHYYGNFWWSKSSHIKNLHKCGNNYPDAEFWVTSINGKYLSLYNHNRNLYDYYLSEYEYSNKLENNIYYTFEYENNLNISYGCDNTFVELTLENHLKKNQVNSFVIIPANTHVRDILYGDPAYGKIKNIKINNELFDDNCTIIFDLNTVTLNVHHNFITDKCIQIRSKDNNNDYFMLDITNLLFKKYYNNKTLKLPILKTIINDLHINTNNIDITKLCIVIDDSYYNYKKIITIENVYYLPDINILKLNSIYYGYPDNKINVTKECFDFFYNKNYKKLIIPNCLSSRNEVFGHIEYKNYHPCIYINDVEYFDVGIILKDIKLQTFFYKSIILYSYYQRNNEYKNQVNFDYFMKYGYKTTNNSLFVIIINNYSEFSENYINNIKKLNNTNELLLIHTNLDNDFESWNFAIKFIEEKFNEKIYNLTDYLCLTNCSIFGPIIKSECDWVDIFINKLNTEHSVACSPMLNYLPEIDAGGPGYRLTSYLIFLKISKDILNLLQNVKISNICKDSLNISKYPLYYNTIIGKKNSKLDTILTGEFGISRILIENNYKITSLVDCNIKKENIDRGFDDTKLEFSLEDLVFIKTNFRTDLGLNRDSLPIYYDESMTHYYNNLDYTRFESDLKLELNYDDIDVNNSGVNKYNSDYSWKSNKDFYNIYGKSENFYIFPVKNLDNTKCIIIINEIDNENLNDYIINNLNEFLQLNYDIYFCTNCNIKNFTIQNVYNLFISEDCKTIKELLANFIQEYKQIIYDKYKTLTIINTDIVMGLQSTYNTLNILNDYEKYDIWSIFYNNKKIDNDFIQFSKILFNEIFDVIIKNNFFEYDFSYLIEKYNYGYLYKNIENLSKLDIYSEFLLWINNPKIFLFNVKKLDKLQLNYKKNFRLNYLLRFYI